MAEKTLREQNVRDILEHTQRMITNSAGKITHQLQKDQSLTKDLYRQVLEQGSHIRSLEREIARLRTEFRAMAERNFLR